MAQLVCGRPTGLTAFLLFRVSSGEHRLHIGHLCRGADDVAGLDEFPQFMRLLSTSTSATLFLKTPVPEVAYRSKWNSRLAASSLGGCALFFCLKLFGK